MLGGTSTHGHLPLGLFPSIPADYQSQLRLGGCSCFDAHYTGVIQPELNFISNSKYGVCSPWKNQQARLHNLLREIGTSNRCPTWGSILRYIYEYLKDWLIKSRPFGLVEDTELSVITKLACGAAAGTVGQTVAYPLDVIRRRMQMVGWKDAGSVVKGEGKSAMEYTGMVDAFRKTVRHEGFGVLYKGLVPNSVKVVPSIAIAFVSYEVIKDVLKVDMRISD